MPPLAPAMIVLGPGNRRMRSLGVGLGGLKSTPKGHHHCGLCSLGAAELGSVPVDQPAPARPWPPHCPQGCMCSGAACFTPQHLTAHLYYIVVFWFCWFFFSLMFVIIFFEEAGHPPPSLTPAPLHAARRAGRGSLRGRLCQKWAGARAAPLNPSSTYSGVTGKGKKKKDTKTQKTNPGT